MMEMPRPWLTEFFDGVGVIHLGYHMEGGRVQVHASQKALGLRRVPGIGFP